MKTVMKFEAFDGTVFDDRKECERYEREHARTRIVGLTEAQIAGAFNPTTDDDHGLAAALEDIGVELRADRSGARRQAAQAQGRWRGRAEERGQRGRRGQRDDDGAGGRSRGRGDRRSGLMALRAVASADRPTGRFTVANVTSGASPRVAAQRPASHRSASQRNATSIGE